MRMQWLIGLVLLATGQLSFGQVSPATCGPLDNAYGPFDYRTTPLDKRRLVETYHFTQETEMLRDPAHSGGDLDYTLRAFPNHPRALRTMDTLGRRLKTETPPGTKYRVECYFERAVRFQQNDPMVRMLYGVYLIARNKKQEGLEQLKEAESAGKGGANLHYNLGLAYFDVGQHDKALEHAKQAYALGFPLPGLRDKLQRAGKWR